MVEVQPGVRKHNMLYDVDSIRYLFYTDPLLHHFIINEMWNFENEELYFARSGLPYSKHERMQNLHRIRRAKLEQYFRSDVGKES